MSGITYKPKKYTIYHITYDQSKENVLLFADDAPDYDLLWVFDGITESDWKDETKEHKWKLKIEDKVIDIEELKNIYYHTFSYVMISPDKYLLIVNLH